MKTGNRLSTILGCCNHFSGRVSRLIILVFFNCMKHPAKRKFLDAAHQAALQYTQFVWFSPEIPDKDILVNKGGEAPLYWYLKRQRSSTNESCRRICSLPGAFRRLVLPLKAQAPARDIGQSSWPTMLPGCIGLAMKPVTHF
jgi:hypothetical protein